MYIYNCRKKKSKLILNTGLEKLKSIKLTSLISEVNKG